MSHQIFEINLLYDNKDDFKIVSMLLASSRKSLYFEKKGGGGKKRERWGKV